MEFLQPGAVEDIVNTDPRFSTKPRSISYWHCTSEIMALTKNIIRFKTPCWINQWKNLGISSKYIICAMRLSSHKMIHTQPLSYLFEWRLAERKKPSDKLYLPTHSKAIQYKSVLNSWIYSFFCISMLRFETYSKDMSISDLKSWMGSENQVKSRSARMTRAWRRTGHAIPAKTSLGKFFTLFKVISSKSTTVCHATNSISFLFLEK